jgi:hypothetical protein
MRREMGSKNADFSRRSTGPGVTAHGMDGPIPGQRSLTKARRVLRLQLSNPFDDSGGAEDLRFATDLPTTRYELREFPQMALLADSAPVAEPARSGGLLTCQRLAQSDAIDPYRKECAASSRRNSLGFAYQSGVSEFSHRSGARGFSYRAIASRPASVRLPQRKTLIGSS